MRVEEHSKILIWLTMLLFAAPACNRNPVAVPPTPKVHIATTAEDVRIGRQAISIKEVSFMLGGGTPQKVIIADVNRRHIPEKISAPLELELRNKGAEPVLIAALKDAKNILTENQKRAFLEHESRMRPTSQNQAVRSYSPLIGGGDTEARVAQDREKKMSQLKKEADESKRKREVADKVQQAQWAEESKMRIHYPNAKRP